MITKTQPAGTIPTDDNETLKWRVTVNDENKNASYYFVNGENIAVATQAAIDLCPPGYEIIGISFWCREDIRDQKAYAEQYPEAYFEEPPRTPNKRMPDDWGPNDG